MTSDKFVSYSRLVVSDYWDKGRVRPYPTKKNLPNGVPSDSANDLLRAYVGLLMADNGMLRDATKLYLSNVKLSQADVAAALTKSTGEEVNVHTVRSKIRYDRIQKLDKFPQDMLVKVINYKVEDLTPYWDAINTALEKYSDARLINNLYIKLPESKAAPMKMGMDEFMEFVGTINPYTPKQIAHIQNNIDSRVLGYAKYLLSSSSLTDEEQTRKAILLGMLGEPD